MRTVKLLLVVFLFLLVAACHEEDGVFHLITPQASSPLAPIDNPDVIPNLEVGLDEPVPTPEPPCTLVKANITRDGRKLYHLPGMPNYNQVKIDEAAGEAFFCTEQAAIDAGWTRAGN